ncbi:MAG TPA: hypothetical protein VFV38_32170 [Ktedonobacteraceae bacterium]|nr:hypothetical protein [Ktedonobacteraceae bacterium]
MSRRLAHRPRYHQMRATSRPLSRPHQDYLRQRWMYRQQHVSYARHPLGYGLSLVPWGWQLVRAAVRREA